MRCAPAREPKRPRRFAVGDRVAVAVEDPSDNFTDWAGGTVAAVDHHPKHYPDAKIPLERRRGFFLVDRSCGRVVAVGCGRVAAASSLRARPRRERPGTRRRRGPRQSWRRLGSRGGAAACAPIPARPPRTARHMRRRRGTDLGTLGAAAALGIRGAAAARAPRGPSKFPRNIHAAPRGGAATLDDGAATRQRWTLRRYRVALDAGRVVLAHRDEHWLIRDLDLQDPGPRQAADGTNTLNKFVRRPKGGAWEMVDHGTRKVRPCQAPCSEDEEDSD